MPERKIASAGLAGALTTILVFVLSQVGVLLPPEVAAAVGVLVTVAVGYLTPSAED
jgi:hypothetical protein